jgi:four helix bundle protein
LKFHEGKSMADAQAPISLIDRTKRFALRVIRVVDSLPRSSAGEVIGRQLLKAGTSVAANYRAAQRARSRAEFRAKLGIVEEEADESYFWLDLIIDAGLIKASRVAPLRQEAHEITAIIVASLRTAKQRSRSSEKNGN